MVKASCRVQRRGGHESRRRRHASLRHDADPCPMTSSRCHLTWCDKVADSGSSSFCRASLWTPLDRRRCLESTLSAASKPALDDQPTALFATPTSGGFLASSRTPTYDFVFDVDMTRHCHRNYFRSPPCCPPSCLVTTEKVDGSRRRSPAPSPTEEVVRLPAHAHRYVEGIADDNDHQPEVGSN